MVKKSRKEKLADWVGKVLRRIRKDGTPHQYVSAFNYAKEVKEW